MYLTMHSAGWLELTPNDEVIDYDDLLAEQDMALEAMLLDEYYDLEDNTDA